MLEVLLPWHSVEAMHREQKIQIRDEREQTPERGVGAAGSGAGGSLGDALALPRSTAQRADSAATRLQEGRGLDVQSTPLGRGFELNVPLCS
jgi:hypothetical protein